MKKTVIIVLVLILILVTLGIFALGFIKDDDKNTERSQETYRVGKISEDYYTGSGFQIHLPEGWTTKKVGDDYVSVDSAYDSSAKKNNGVIAISVSEYVGDEKTSDEILEDVEYAVTMETEGSYVTSREKITLSDGTPAYILNYSFFLEVNEDLTEGIIANGYELFALNNGILSIVKGFSSEDEWPNYKDILKESLLTFRLSNGQ